MDGDQAVYKKPEPLREFPWRQDDGYAFVEPQQYLTCWVPGTDSVLSSLTPHRTGPNITNHVRRAYILQYAPTGTVVKHGPNPRDKMSAYDPDRQYEVLRIGIAVH